MADRLGAALPARLGRESQKLAVLRQRLATAGQGGLHRRCLRFTQAVATLDAISPVRVLARGYAVATKGARGAVVSDARTLKAGDTLRIRFAKGAADCRVTDIREES